MCSFIMFIYFALLPKICYSLCFSILFFFRSQALDVDDQSPRTASVTHAVDLRERLEGGQLAAETRYVLCLLFVVCFKNDHMHIYLIVIIILVSVGNVICLLLSFLCIILVFCCLSLTFIQLLLYWHEHVFVLFDRSQSCFLSVYYLWFKK
jgi:hypothetical protein